MLRFGGGGDLVALVDPGTDLIQRHRAREQNGDQIAAADMIAGEKAVLPYQQIDTG